MTSHSFDSDPLEFVTGGFRDEEFPLVHWHAFARTSDLTHLSKSNLKFYVWWNHGCIISTGYQTGNTVPLQFFFSSGDLRYFSQTPHTAQKAFCSLMDALTRCNDWHADMPSDADVGSHLASMSGSWLWMKSCIHWCSEERSRNSLKALWYWSSSKARALNEGSMVRDLEGTRKKSYFITFQQNQPLLLLLLHYYIK